MKQRIRVVGIVRKKDDVLLLKKNLGRADGVSVWELPTGKIQFGEQPEEAMSRVIYENLGVQVSSVKLRDVITFMHLEGASQMGNLYIVFEVKIDDEQKIVPKDKYTAYKFFKENDQIGLELDSATLSVLSIEFGREIKKDVSYRYAANGATVFVDGCSRGNPGPSAVGYCIIGEDGELLRKGGEFIGFATSRVAEYYALKYGCEQAIELGLKSVRFVSDNLMLINQMNGIYKIKNDDLAPIYEDVQILLKKFSACAFVHVKRSQNIDADREANAAIDRHSV